MLKIRATNSQSNSRGQNIQATSRAINCMGNSYALTQRPLDLNPPLSPASHNYSGALSASRATCSACSQKKGPQLLGTSGHGPCSFGAAVAGQLLPALARCFRAAAPFVAPGRDPEQLCWDPSISNCKVIRRENNHRSNDNNKVINLS